MKGNLLSLSFFILSPIIFSCSGVPQEEYQTLQTENEKLNHEIQQLKVEIDDLKYGASRLLNQAKIYFENKNFSRAQAEVKQLITLHPASKESDEAKQLLIVLDEEIKKEERAKEKAKAEKERAKKARLANATQKLRRKHDEMTDVTMFHDRSTPRSLQANNFHIYIAQMGKSKPYLRFQTQYTGDDWLFIENYIIKTETESFTIEPEYGKVNRDNGYSGVWEWYDAFVDDKIYNIISNIIQSKNVRLRYNGKQYYKDRNMSNSEIQGIKNVLDAYEAMGGDFDFKIMAKSN